MKLILFDCVNPETKADITIYVNPESIAFVSGGVLPGEVVSFPDGKPSPVEAAAIVFQNGQFFMVKDTMENVVALLENGKGK